MAEEYIPDERKKKYQRKNLQKQAITGKIIQKNDSEDDPRSQKRNVSIN